MRTLLNYISIITILVMLPLIAVAQVDTAVVYINYNEDCTIGGNGSSWTNAINGNAYYHYDGTCTDDYETVSFTGNDREVTSDSRFDRMTFIFENVRIFMGFDTSTKIYLVCRESGDMKFEFSENQSDATEFYLVPANYDGNGTITSYYICLKSNPKYKMWAGESGPLNLFADFMMADESTVTLGVSYEWKIYKNGNRFYFINGNNYSFGRNTNNKPDGENVDAIYSGVFNRNWTIYDRQKGFQYALVKAKNASKPSYVFVKEGDYVKSSANKAKARDNAIVIPEGVHLYGSIQNSFNDEAQTGQVKEYVEKVMQTRPGIASSTASRTRVGNVMTIETESYDTETIFDGLYVDSIGKGGTVMIDDGGKKKVTLCNSIITGATTITSGLLYNSLVENNLTLAANGCAANVTYTGSVSNIGNRLRLRKKTPKLSSYFEYQLAENEVDFGASSSTPAISTPYSGFGAINYTTDRDLLGNPRKIGAVDNGAFEAWCVPQDETITTKDYSDLNVETKPTDKPWKYYPVDGTNVYLMAGSNFVLGKDLTTGKLIVKESASLYGQGYNVNVNDISVDLSIPEEGKIISLPFACDYSSKGTAYTYNGSEVNGRAKPGYKLNSGNCWISATNPVSACQGVFFVPTTAGTVRFSATGTDVYTEESASTNKGVTLTQYDDNVSEANNDASFTSAENMGWNCIGIPYLVSDYRPYLGYDGEAYTSGNYMMNIPHTLWLYYDNTNSYQPVSSWDGTDWHLGEDETAHLWFGEGFFTQTAAVSATETLTFYRPVYVAPASSSPAKSMANTRHYVAPQKEELMLESQSSVVFNVNRNILTISNLKGDEKIDICSADGIQHRRAEVRNGTYSCMLRTGMYVIKVNDLVRKVMVK